MFSQMQFPYNFISNFSFQKFMSHSSTITNVNVFFGGYVFAVTGRPPGPELNNCTNRESYSLAAGLALGMVTLGVRYAHLTDL